MHARRCSLPIVFLWHAHAISLCATVPMSTPSLLHPLDLQDQNSSVSSLTLFNCQADLKTVSSLLTVNLKVTSEAQHTLSYLAKNRDFKNANAFSCLASEPSTCIQAQEKMSSDTGAALVPRCSFHACFTYCTHTCSLPSASTTYCCSFHPPAWLSST